MLLFPPEWIEQQSVQLTWPHKDTDWSPWLDAIVATYLDMADAITRYEQLIVVTPEPDNVRCHLENKLSKVQMERVRIVDCPTNDTWARDHSFITLIDEAKDKGHSHCLLDFRFNGWGDKFEATKDNAINRNLFDKGVLKGEYENHLDFVLEGGAIESDGKGTVFTTSCCLLADHRNQPLSREEIENELMKRLRCERVVWIDYGHLEGDDTDGHIDTLVRTAPDDTLLYVQCTDTSDSHYEDLHNMEQQLQELRTADGKPYRLLPLPMAPAQYDDGERLPTTYANFLVINGAVLVPVYGNEALDKEAMDVVQKAFPDRKMIAIDSRTIVLQHGSVHCCTMQMPL